MRKFELPLSWRMYAAFCLLNYLMGAGHELAHHGMGYVSSGHFGRISFGLFAAPTPDLHPILTSLAGPVFTLLVAWVGAAMLCAGSQQLVGYALIASSHSFMRLVSVVGRGGDESIAASNLFGHLPYRQLVALELLLVLPPLIVAWLALANRNRSWVFVASVVGPFLPLIPLKFIDDRWFATFVHTPGAFRQPVFLGVPAAIVLSHCIVFLFFATFGIQVLKASARTSAIDRTQFANA